MNIYLHDNEPEKPCRPDAPDDGEGPTHCGTIRNINYDYQVEMWVSEIEAGYPHVVRIKTSTGREWKRGAGGRFEEQNR